MDIISRLTWRDILAIAIIPYDALRHTLYVNALELPAGRVAISVLAKPSERLFAYVQEMGRRLSAAMLLPSAAVSANTFRAAIRTSFCIVNYFLLLHVYRMLSFL